MCLQQTVWSYFFSHIADIRHVDRPYRLCRLQLLLSYRFICRLFEDTVSFTEVMQPYNLKQPYVTTNRQEECSKFSRWSHLSMVETNVGTPYFFLYFVALIRAVSWKTKRLSDIASSDVKYNKRMYILYAAFLVKGDVFKRSRRSWFCIRKIKTRLEENNCRKH